MKGCPFNCLPESILGTSVPLKPATPAFCRNRAWIFRSKDGSSSVSIRLSPPSRKRLNRIWSCLYRVGRTTTLTPLARIHSVEPYLPASVFLTRAPFSVAGSRNSLATSSPAGAAISEASTSAIHCSRFSLEGVAIPSFSGPEYRMTRVVPPIEAGRIRSSEALSSCSKSTFAIS